MIVKFRNLETEIEREVLLEKIIDVDFGGEMMVQFEKNDKSEFVAVNAMDGWGNNIADEVMGEKLLIKV